MKPLELFTIGGELQKAGYRWETWSGSFYTSDAKGWWFIPGAIGPTGMRRGDPQPYDLATITTYELYVKEEVNGQTN
jgi:hypothetical protein